MSDSMIILLGGLGAAVAWGISDYLAAHSAKKVGPTLASLVVNVLGALLFVCFYLLFFGGEAISSTSGVIYSVVSGIILALGAFAFFRGLEKGPVSIVSPLTSLYPLVTTLLAIIVFNANLTVRQGFGIILIVVGVLAASGLLNKKKSERLIASGPKYGLMAAFFWGIGYSLLAQGITRLGWQTASMIEFTTVAVTFVVLTPFLKNEEEISLRTIKAAVRNKYILGATIIQPLGVVALNYGLSKEASSGAVVTALSATYPLLTVFLALKHMKEKVSLLPLAGALVGVIGVIIVTLG